MRRISKGGFSLIELFVTISIVWILMPLLIVGVQAAREAARRTKYSNNLRQVALAVQMYCNTFDFLPALTCTYKSYCDTQKTDLGTQIGTCGAQIFLLPYLEGAKIYEDFDSFPSPKPVSSEIKGFFVIEPFPPNIRTSTPTGLTRGIGRRRIFRLTSPRENE